MRGIGAAARRGAHLPSSYAAAFSSFSGIGGGGGGAGRGRGSGAPPFGQPRAPGRPIPDDDAADPFSAPASVGRGRGRGEPVPPSSSTIPSFSGAGHGRGSPLPPPPAPEDGPKQPTFTKRFDDASPAPDPEQLGPDSFSSALARSIPSAGAGRGVPRLQQPPADKAPEENRFIRRRDAQKAAASSSAPSTQPKLSAADAVKRALQLLGGGEGAAEGGHGGGGRGGRGGRGYRGGRGGRGRGRSDRGRDEVDERERLYIGDDADAENLAKYLGEEKMKILDEALEEATENVLPDPEEDAYMDACHTNNMIEFEPEYHVNFDNPDVDEKPPMSLEEMLQKIKPFIVAYEGIQNQEEWEEAVKDVMKRAPHMKELIDMYSGPDVVTAKQQEEELQRVASTLPDKIPSSVNRFTDKILLSLKNNPGWGFDKKCQFMDKFAREVSDLYK